MKKRAHQKAQSPVAAGQSAVQSTGNAVNCKPGRLPVRLDTVISAVLASLLEGRILTVMDTVFGENTTRLPHHVLALRDDHEWFIDRRDKVVGTSDGRVETIREYWIAPDLIEAAMAQGARAWINEVRTARAALRRKSAEARRQAEQLEAARKRRPPPGQLGLFGGTA